MGGGILGCIEAAQRANLWVHRRFYSPHLDFPIFSLCGGHFTSVKLALDARSPSEAAFW